MIRVAFLEHEKETKDIVFELSKIFDSCDWTFRHYFKASELAKACQDMEFHMFVFDEMFKTPRIESVFVHDHPNALILYVCSDANDIKEDDSRQRIIYISKEQIKEDIEKNKESIFALSQQVDLYSLIYDGIHVNLAYEDIYYLEKMEKMVYFHTKRGVFHKRMNMSGLEKTFETYGFIRVHVSYMVNEKHIIAWYSDSVELFDHTRIPLSRSQKRKIMAARKQKRQNFNQ